MSKITIKLDRKDIETAMQNYLNKKYPTLKPISMIIAYDNTEIMGQVDCVVK